MKAVFLALFTLKAAYTVYSSDAELKAMLQENSLFGNLWEHPEFDSTLESIGNRKSSVRRIKSEEDCALECTQTQDCAAFIVQVLCERSRACKLIFKPGFDRTLKTLERAKYFTLRYTSENEVQGAFYRPDTGSYHLVVGTLMVTYNTLADLVNGNPQPVRGAGTLFPKFGKTVDDVLVRQVVDGQNSYLLFYLLNHNKCHTYRLDSQVEPATKVSVEQLEFLKSLEYIDAAVELNHCQNCPNSPSRKAYFLLDGEHVYEAPVNTWLHSADGKLHVNKTFSGSPFPGGLTAVTAAVKYDGSDEGLILFEGLKFYHYNMTNKVMQSLGEVDLCR